MYRVMRCAWEVHAVRSAKGPGPEELLRMATLGGAEAMGFDDIGSLEPGKSADFQVLDWNQIVPAGAPPAESAHDLVSRIVHRGNRSAIRQVYVAGASASITRARDAMWDADQYERFRASGPARSSTSCRASRTESYKSIVDLGCGTGDLTARAGRPLARGRACRRRPSEEMLAARGSRREAGRLEFVKGDLATWRAGAPSS
jgi:hypothetical protein